MARGSQLLRRRLGGGGRVCDSEALSRAVIAGMSRQGSGRDERVPGEPVPCGVKGGLMNFWLMNSAPRVALPDKKRQRLEGFFFSF